MKAQHLPGVLVLALATAFHASAAQQPPALNWYRGSLQTHTINSDGDSSPWDLVTWYKRNGYQFLAITDHNTFTAPASFDSNPNDNFLLLGAEEVVIPPQPALFVGRNGRELATSRENPARYKFTGSEGFVRARIEDSGGLRAWTQPVAVGAQSQPAKER